MMLLANSVYTDETILYVQADLGLLVANAKRAPLHMN